MTDVDHTTELAAVRRRLEDARAAFDYAIRTASGDGMPLREIGKLVGLSHQRISQIIRNTNN